MEAPSLTIMFLRFKADQEHCLRAGIFCPPQAIVTIEINPNLLTREQLNAIAERLVNGIEVHPLVVPVHGGEVVKGPDLILVKGSEFAHLMDAINENAKEVEEALRVRRAVS